ncbi:MAG: hypothetical protein Q9184_005725 [Pyrenodesmia sp. 2 TL-2023]
MDSLPTVVSEALTFEATNCANGPAVDDPFYRAPDGAEKAAPGSTLKVEEVDTSKYLLPPATAMSRIMYQSENLKGAVVPTSAYVLWPYSPGSQPDGYPVVGWAHGTSGFFPNAAPSNHKSLLQHWLAPFPLALNGYVVVAPDYAGLGVSQHPSGEPIGHEYLASTSHANDLVYAVQAAQQQFKELSKSFVVMGHSQGGAAAWAAAIRQSNKPIPGYLGAVAVSPLVDIIKHVTPPFVELIVTTICPAVKATFPEFNPEEVLTAEGQRRLAMLQSSGAQLGSGIILLQGVKLMKDGWTENGYIQNYNNKASLAGKGIAGSLLVVHGQADDRLGVAHVTSAVQSTIKSFPQASIDYVVLPGVTHAPALTASQRIWMDWIADRFAGRELKAGLRRTKLIPAKRTESYQRELNWYVTPATQSYHTP